MKYVHVAIISLLLCVIAPGALEAQFDQGQISGTVTDPSQAKVPGAAVSATNLETGLKVATKTGNGGSYVLVNLKVGAYRVEIEVQGFRKYIQDKVSVDAAVRTMNPPPAVPFASFTKCRRRERSSADAILRETPL